MTNRMTRRSAMRAKKQFPFGKFFALLTAAFVTLIGVFLQLEPLTILVRATVSAMVMGTTVSLGISIVRLADAEHKKQHMGRS